MTTWRDKGKVFRGTNVERMATGRAPVGYDGNAVNLHHMLQTQNGPIAEMSQTFHKTNHGIIHINPTQSLRVLIELHLMHGASNIG
ncbi:HNH/ENDO VII family nuclease [Erwinia tracheiphila]